MEPNAETSATIPASKYWRHKRSLVQLKRWWEIAAPVAAIAYGIGFMARAFHAYQYNFGALPGARFEYLVAGGLIVASVAILATIIMIIRRANHAASRWAENSRWRRFIVLLIHLSLTLPVLYWMQMRAIRKMADYNSLSSVDGLIMAFVILILLDSIMIAHINGPRLKHLYSAFSYIPTLINRIFSTYYSLIIIMLLISVTVISANALRWIPQEFGGVKPKLAILDLERKSLSPELASLLAGPDSKISSSSSHGTTPSATEIIRSRCLSVFSTADPWLVQIPIKGSGKGQRHAYRSIRISDDAVNSVEWIDPTTLGTTAEAACAALQ